MLVDGLAGNVAGVLLFRGQRYGPGQLRADGIVALSPAPKCSPAIRCGRNSAGAGAKAAALSEERTLKMQLKLGWRTGTGWKGAFEVSDCLQQRIRVQALGRWLLAAKPGPQPVQSLPQFLAQPVECLQGQRQAQLFRGCLD